MCLVRRVDLQTSKLYAKLGGFYRNKTDQSRLLGKRVI